MPPLTVGVLLPISRRMPGLDRDFLAGLRGALEASGVEHRLAVELTGNAAIQATVVEKTQRLLLEHRPAAITGVIGAPMLRHVTALFGESKTPFVVGNLGADPLLDAGISNPFIVHDSLDLWRSTYALGRWAATHVGRRAVMAVGHHEAGYSIVGAMWSGFCGAGGEVLAVEVTHRSSAEEDPSDCVERLLAQEPEVVLALYSGNEGVSLVNTLRELASRPVPVVATAPTLHRRWLSQMGEAAVGMRTGFGWHGEEASPAMSAFRAACASGGSAEPDMFGLLGYECGLTIAGAMRACDSADGEQFLRALPDVTIESPRGSLRFDPGSGEMRGGAHHLFEVQGNAGAGVRMARVGTIEAAPECDAAFAELKRQEVRAGWINPYLVT